MNLELVTNPDDLRAMFFALETREDVATILGITDKQLIYYLYIFPLTNQYTMFRIPKKTGGERAISAPSSPLKIIQRKLNQILQCVYEPKPAVHGFVQNKNIVSNAKAHQKRRYVLNIDLLDFFPSINFGRVRGMFMSHPYNRNASVATVLAQICCFNNQLPQGAPTSPIASNMICAKMDAQLQQLAKRYKCTYTRYADDITFSTTKLHYPAAIAQINETGKAEVGEALASVVQNNGFRINQRKVRLQTRSHRQEVTGLTTNIFPNVQRRYIREIRAMLHALRKYELIATQITFENKYYTKHIHPGRQKPSFLRVLQGKIQFLGMVRGKDNPIYLRLRKELWELVPELAKPQSEEDSVINLPVPLVITEGKTDWKHLKTAYLKLKAAGIIRNLEIDFLEYGDETPMGDAALLKHCMSYAITPQDKPKIFIFDRDQQKTVEQISDRDRPYKDWTNWVFSFAIPIPEHRSDTKEISIEFYYQDKDLKRRDSNGRRLFLSDEFEPQTGRLLSSPETFCADRNKFKRSTVTIVDSDSKVWNFRNENIALSKGDFADLIANDDEHFRTVDFSAFVRVFDLISTILHDIAQSP